MILGRRWIGVIAASVGAIGGWSAGTVGVSAAAADRWHTAVVETTADMSLHLAELPAAEFQSGLPPGVPVVSVSDDSTFQRITGFGAALTDSAAWLIGDQLSEPARTALMSALFSPQAAHIDVVRVPIGASDFTASGLPYSYDDMPPGQADPKLRHFSIAHDYAYIIPTLRQMLSINPEIKIIATPWSPPGWMKTNHALNDTGHRGILRRKYYRAWAAYFVRFIQAYRRAGIRITAVTPQNEPGVASAYPGMELPVSVEKVLVANYLRPALRAAGLHTKVYGGDHEWGLPSYEESLVKRGSRHVFDGISWHCYGGIPTTMSELHRIDRAAYQIENECATAITPYATPEVLIGAMRNWASAAELWNIALDPNGGPVQPPNSGCGGCTGLVTIDEKTSSAALSIYYYQLAQMSEFVQPGAVRIGSNNLLSYFRNGSAYGAGPGLDDVAFRNPDGRLVLDAYNNTSWNYGFAISWDGRYLPAQLPPYASATFVWNAGP